ncbi:hypothetical protein B0H66DRAFT_636291 [Apodospora peruviana]|uniref:Apple domain-containing protein n=1 Tax=Apodospora peruviana TaxID=516989 RepID=A0AAE0IUB6_9PEZI|nr:hypothetical protein B0H66DRAFT_636291 [Apodospora peruviana]
MDTTPEVVRSGAAADAPEVYQHTQWTQPPAQKTTDYVGQYPYNGGNQHHGGYSSVPSQATHQLGFSSQAPTSPQQPNDASKKRLRRTNLLWGIALAVVVIAAAVGGGVGGTLAVQNARNAACSSTSTPPSSTSTSAGAGGAGSSTKAGPYTADPTAFVMPLAATDIATLANPPHACPTDIYQHPRNDSAAFKTFCQKDLNGADITNVISYTFEDCVDACLSYNRIPGEDVCVGVSMGLNLQDQIFGNSGGNCWLKKATLPSVTPALRVWSAVLCMDRDCKKTYETQPT